MKAQKQAIESWNKTSSKQDFENLFAYYYAPLCGYAFKILKKKESCEEITQDLFLKLWEERKTLEIENIKAYLYRSTYHQCLHSIEHQKVKQKHQHYEQYNADIYPSPEEGMMLDELYHVYQTELKNMPQKTQKIFTLSRDADLKYSEIAHQLSISIKTVEAHISKALKTFRMAFHRIDQE